MAKVRNILFVMSDQLRADYLSCYGHPSLETPHIDSLAQCGVKFDRAFVQSPVCGPSRMSYYTGRYPFSHGASWNFVPLPVGERTLGDYLRSKGMRVALTGKTHMAVDEEGMQRLGISTNTNLGILVSECGFEPFERDDGENPEGRLKPDYAYNNYLRSMGFDGPNPWHKYANSALGTNGEILSGWALRNADKPARIPDEYSETAYITDRALDFMKEQDDNPWCLHLSYIKPHWPYIVSEPYHNLYGLEDCLPLHRNDAERLSPHPVYQGFMNMPQGQSFAREEVCQRVVPTYMGLVKQLDDHFGRIMAYLESSGRMQDTMIVFTSDHGDFLGDHWLGEKELFYEEALRVPLIIYDPDPDADTMRNRVDDRLVEAIDLVPTFIESVGMEVPDHILEGQSLLPALRGGQVDTQRDHVYSELDYAFYNVRKELKLSPNESRAFMIRSDRWKYIYHQVFPPQLFDLVNDPDEYVDLGQNEKYNPIRVELKEMLFQKLINRKWRVTVPTEVVKERTGMARKRGVIIGEW